MYSLFIEPFTLPFMGRALVELLLLGALGGVVSVFVVLRRLAFVSDALTHTVFPGVVIGYVAGGTGGVLWGALAFAGLSAVLLTLLTTHRRVPEDAALAILLTGFFSVGVVLVSRRSSYTSDLTAFLFGRVLTVDRAQIVTTLGLAVVVLATLAVLGKELVLRTFDAPAAAALGYRVPWLDLALNLVVALVVVAAVRAVGTVLVIALLVVPGAAARLVSDRLGRIIGLAVAFGALGGWLGLVVSYDVSVRRDVRLGSGATVVLVLVALYAVASIVGFLKRRVPA